MKLVWCQGVVNEPNRLLNFVYTAHPCINVPGSVKPTYLQLNCSGSIISAGHSLHFLLRYQENLGIWLQVVRLNIYPVFQLQKTSTVYSLGSSMLAVTHEKVFQLRELWKNAQQQYEWAVHGECVCLWMRGVWYSMWEGGWDTVSCFLALCYCIFFMGATCVRVCNLS